MFARGGWPSSECSGAAASILREGPAAPGRRLLEVVRETIRARQMSRRTEETYIGWIRRYVLFHGKRHPRDLGPADIGRFLTWLATEAQVSASTQNQALAALLFLYRAVLGLDVPWIDGIVRARTSRRLPVVLTRARCGPCSTSWTGHPGLSLCSSTVQGSGCSRDCGCA